MSYPGEPKEPPILVGHRLGGWLPVNHRILEVWLKIKIDAVTREEVQLLPVIQDFKSFIEGNPVIYMGFHQMFDQVPTKPPYDTQPDGKPQVRDYSLMLDLFNKVIQEAPSWEAGDLVGFPINAIIDWPMGTPAGFQMFCDPRVNRHFKHMFNTWTQFLTSADSTNVLTEEDGGWFSPPALEAMPNFVENYVCDPTVAHWGFTSWDNFFTRLFRPGVRPVASPDDNKIVNSACESAFYAKATDIKEIDTFWIKGQPYSLSHLFNHHRYIPQFIGGTLFQAFLSATKYHRWHSPVNGVINETVLIPGTYYAEDPLMGFDPAGPNDSQGFITQTAARALIFIEADDPSIGLMCFVAVGMAEVSTCQITVYQGQVVRKGDQIGMFHFGGSTHCLIFRPETKITFYPEVETAETILLSSAIATVE